MLFLRLHKNPVVCGLEFEIQITKIVPNELIALDYISIFFYFRDKKGDLVLWNVRWMITENIVIARMSHVKENSSAANVFIITGEVMNFLHVILRKNRREHITGQ